MTLQDNSDSIDVIESEFDTLNQNLIISLSDYMKYSGILAETQKMSSKSDKDAEAAAVELSKLFASLRDSLNAGTLYLTNEKGKVLVGSEMQYNGRNIIEAFGEEVSSILAYQENAEGQIIANGTATYDANGTRKERHISTGDYYTYSTLLAKDGESYYFLLTSIPTSLLESEVSGLKRIDNVLKGVSVGKDGFLFAIDNNEGKFIYFNDKETDLSGESYAEYGLSSRIEASDYAGYEKINGTDYYCVTKEFKSPTFGDYTIIAAAESRATLLDRNQNVVAFSGIAFVLVSGLVAGYALILRRDIANRIIYLEEKFFNDYKDDIQDGKFSYTEEEILERTELRLQDAIYRQTDTQFKRLNIGSRSRSAAQPYVSLFIVR
ncbi:MAG: hypothetical protein KBS81_02720 [Spirochaetales bacterium]|nr:hypothetical protein [Candidatus Physcosoma equi]